MKKQLSPSQSVELLNIVSARFEKNSHRHKGMDWPNLKARLETSKEKMWSLHQMESTGGEPDVVGYDKQADEFILYDCSVESPAGRR